MGSKTRYADAMLNFEFHGMSFGGSEDDIEEFFSDCAYDKASSDPKAGIGVYNVEATGVDEAKLWFFSGRLYMVTLIYGAARVASMGDWTAIADRLVARFGKANAESSGVFDENENGQFVELDWYFEEIDRWIKLEVFSHLAAVNFVDGNTHLAAFNKKKQAADLGF